MVSAVSSLVSSSPPSTFEALSSRIVAYARGRFMSEGFSRVTMEDISKALRISKKTLYRHFPTKKILLQTVMQNKLTEVETLLHSIVTTSKSYPTKFRLLMDTVRSCLREASAAYIQDLATLEPELFDKVKTHRARVIRNTFAHLLKEGVRLGKIRNDLPIKTLTGLIIAILDSVIVPDKLVELGLTPQSGMNIIFPIIFKGLSK